MKIEAILEELKYNKGKFPRRAIEEAIKQKEMIIPHLLIILEKSINNVEKLKKDDYRIDFIFAMILLAQFREKKAFPLIIKFFTTLEADNYWFCGDFVTENLPEVLASVFDGNTKPLIRVIEKPNINVFIRNSVFQSLVILYLHEDIERKECIEYFKQFLQNPEIKKEEYLIGEIAYHASELYFRELYNDIKKIYNEELIDLIEYPFEDIESNFSKTQRECIIRLKNNVHYQKIENTIKEMEWWACFNDNQKHKKYITDYPEDKIDFNSFGSKSEIYQRETPKIGRNDPCTCGSGKKYKKCCGS